MVRVVRKPGVWMALSLLILCTLIFIVGVAPVRLSPASGRASIVANHSSGPTAVTDVEGRFRFTDLERGTHRLYLDASSLPLDFRPRANASQISLWLNPGQSLVSERMPGGIRFKAAYESHGRSIQGVVFVDRNDNGRQDSSEGGLVNITVIDPTIHQYFVPFSDDDLWTLFAEINDNRAIGECLRDSATSTTLHSVVSLTSSSDGTRFFYDHWEDGYDTDPLDPGLTTEVGVLDTGVTRVFEDLVTTPRTVDPLLYDGRDRITIFGERATVMRAVYPTLPGERLAGAWEVPEVSDWGRRYISVVGEDLDVNGTTADDFDYVGLQVMAAQPDTGIWMNGTLLTTTLRAGATFLVDGENDGAGGGGIDSTDLITATGPIQVQVLGAGCAQTYSARAYTLQPVDVWTNDYWAPVPDFAESAWCDIDLDGVLDDDRDTDILLHNPLSRPITVMLDDRVGVPVPLGLAPHQTISVLATLGRDLSDTRGAHLFSADRFWGVSAIDSTSGSSANSGSQINDWGYSLIPVDRLSSRVVMGWSPGNSLQPPTRDPRHNSGNLAFVSAFTDTVVYVDLYVEPIGRDGLVIGAEAFDINGDGDADDFDVFGNPNFDEPRSDDGIPLQAGEVLRVADPNDRDLTGAVIYTQDLTQKIAVAWGQDPCRSERQNPYLDLGYTVLAVPIPSVAKQDDPSLEASVSGKVSPGEVLTYTVTMRNSGLGPMFDGRLTDTLPYTVTDFIVDSLAVTEPPTLGTEDYFDGDAGVWGYTPVPTSEGDDPAVWALRLSWPVIGASGTVTATFRVLLDKDLPPDLEELCNRATFCSEETGCTTAEVCTPVGRPNLLIDKVGEPDPVKPGQLLTYTVVATNTGDGTALGSLVFDDLPPFVTYQPGTLDLTLPSVIGRLTTTTVPVTTAFSGSYMDDFDLTITETSGYAGSDGTVAWSTDWIEVNDPIGPGPTGGDVRVGATSGADLSSPGYLEIVDSDDIGSGVTRGVDLTGFVSPTLRFFVSGANSPNGDFQVLLNGNTLLTEQYTGPYVRRVLNLSSAAGAPGILQFMVSPDLIVGDAYRFDNIRVIESSPLRTESRSVVKTIGVLTYTTRTGIDPIAYDPVANVMTVTDQLRVPAGGQVRFGFQVRVASPLTDGLRLLNQATITASNVVTSPQDAAETTVVSNHVLTITKTGEPAIAFIGEEITYTLIWEVGGDEPAPGVVVTDTIPWSYVRYVGCQGGRGCQFVAPDTVVWRLGDFLPVASGIHYARGRLALTVQVEEHPPLGILTNTVVLDDRTDTPPDEDDETTQVRNAGLALTKRRFTPSPVHIGDPVGFLITITNTGALTITHLPLVDLFDPVYLAYDRGTSPVPDETSQGMLTWVDLTTGLPYDYVLPSGEQIAVTVWFTALSSTVELVPSVTVNVAASDGAQTIAGRLPRVQDDAKVRIEAPTAIELIYFQATPKARGVLVEWATLLEVDTFGFLLRRGEGPDMAESHLLSFVPARGWGGLGATYRYLDADLPFSRFYYWLVEVENGGKETIYGPVSANAGQDTSEGQLAYLPLVIK